jgi:DNA topoisomerase I
MKRLVVVESPTKIKKLREYLPPGYRIEASRGHVRDLPSSAAEIPEKYRGQEWARLGVDVAHDFEPLYVVPSEKRAVVKTLKDALKEADELIIATDGDREGESIGWHLVQVLAPKVPVRRMVFTEITKEGVQSALAGMRTMDEDLVEAQEARRILDRLVGYSVSPVLWRKVAKGLSAGRVQSVAVRLVAERELERLSFVGADYAGIKALVSKDGSQKFEAQLTHVGERRVATGRDFDAQGRLTDEKALRLAMDDAQALAERLPSLPWRVANVEAKEQRRSPAAPFITSTLQQEAARKLGMSAKQTMRTAQALYEGGFITYMRTDSTALSNEAVEAARRAVRQRYGDDYLTNSPRTYAGKVRNAQEAHEAIRPAGTAMKTSAEHGLSGPEARLYDLIWVRTVASQMADARLRLVTTTLDAGGEATFRASGRTILFPGFFRAYVEGSDDPDAALEDRDQPLPDLAKDDPLRCHRASAERHETKPPARFTESALIKVLESEGVGRPSTFATIVDTIEQRGYVRNEKRTLYPTFTALAVTRLMERQFEDLVDLGFTAGMEETLDRIAEGRAARAPFLKGFYGDLEGRVETGMKTLDAREVSTLQHEVWAPYAVRIGRYGPYVEGTVEGEPRTASLPDDLAPADLTRERIAELLDKGTGDEGLLGIHPTLDQPVLLRKGPYGDYVQLGDDEQEGKPRRMSLPKGVTPAEVTLELAISLLELPRTVGRHPESGQEIRASLGRFGPYVQHGSTFASLPADVDLFEVTLDQALELLARKERKNAPLRTLGAHPDDGAPVELFAGRYGPYVKHGSVNASLPRGADEGRFTLDQAVELLRARAASAPAKGKGRGASTKKAPAKKAAPKSAAAKPKGTKPASK